MLGNMMYPIKKSNTYSVNMEYDADDEKIWYRLVYNILEVLGWE